MSPIQFHDSSLTDWYKGALGQELAVVELAQLQEIWQKLEGQYWLELGNSNFLEGLQSSGPVRRIILSHQITKKHFSCVEGLYTALPFADDSMDIILLPHLLEFEQDVKPILSEAWRILSTRGHLVILGFNPWSLWGLRRLFSKQSEVPWSGYFQSAEKLRRVLINMNAEIIFNKNFFFRPPINDTSFLTHTRWTEKILQFLLPANAGAYLLVAKKNVIPLTTLKERWTWQPVLQNNKELAPTARKSL